MFQHFAPAAVAVIRKLTAVRSDTIHGNNVFLTRSGFWDLLFTMITLLSPNFVLQAVTEGDMAIASVAWGFTLGFGFLTTWTAIKQTRAVWKRYGNGVWKSGYIWMVWLEILVCLLFSVICWCHLHGDIPPSFAFYFVILALWALQVQLLLQIIINRVGILMVSRRKAGWIKAVVAVVITSINISVYFIWIPARLQISPAYEHLNDIWDRIEKGIYLIIDGGLNWYFMRVVQKQLIGLGLTKYSPLLKFNLFIIGFSLAMDVLIISMMSLNNSFVYMQFHPLAYIVKLRIEMAMAELIAKVSKAGGTDGPIPHCSCYNLHSFPFFRTNSHSHVGKSHPYVIRPQNFSSSGRKVNKSYHDIRVRDMTSSSGSSLTTVEPTLEASKPKYNDKLKDSPDGYSQPLNLPIPTHSMESLHSSSTNVQDLMYDNGNADRQVTSITSTPSTPIATFTHELGHTQPDPTTPKTPARSSRNFSETPKGAARDPATIRDNLIRVNLKHEVLVTSSRASVDFPPDFCGLDGAEGVWERDGLDGKAGGRERVLGSRTAIWGEQQGPPPQ